MDITELLASIDSEITLLQQVRTLLVGEGGRVRNGNRQGGKRVLSAEARARIAAAQRKRWAAQKKTGKKAA